MILTAMSEVLRSSGFRKKGANFTRQLPEVVHFIGLQSSQSSTGTCLRATLNLSIWVHVAAEANQEPDALSAHWRERIGMLMPARSDHWWVISSEKEVQTAIEEICRALREYGLPALDCLTSSEAMRNLWRSGRSPGLTERLAQRYLQRLEKSQMEANPQGGANRSQPGSSETNSTSSAAASGRSP
jgi:Domain of unknown function (DUF4304)